MSEDRNRGLRRWKAGAAGTLAALALWACDPGYVYSPLDWVQRPDGGWYQSWDEVELRLYDYVAVVGSTGVLITLYVTNRASDPFSVRRVELVTNTDTHPGGVIGAETVAAGRSGRVNLRIELGEDSRVLRAERFDLVLRLSSGSRDGELRIGYRRARALGPRFSVGDP